MQPLLECVGFPPDHDPEEIAARVRARGESVPGRGRPAAHLRLPLAPDLELRLDLAEDPAGAALWPFFRAGRRLRVAVLEARRPPHSPFDAFLRGVANPLLPPHLLDGEPELPPDAPTDEYPLAAWLHDGRRLPRALEPGHVLAVEVAGFALDVARVAPDGTAPPGAAAEAGAGAPDEEGHPSGARLAPLGGPDDPGGCMEVSAAVRRVRRVENPLTGDEVVVLEVEAPGRPLALVASRRQFEEEGLPTPRVGDRVEGAFLFGGRIAGGLEEPRRRRPFG